MRSNLNLVRLTDLAEINPLVPLPRLDPDSLVSFIPMSDVSENGKWRIRQTRKFSEVKNGFRPFQEGDVLFAKITPCMENGKGCYAVGLTNGFGFGTTEFHVLRAKPGKNARFIYHLVHSTALRRRAEVFMTGSAGQQRVPADFFAHYCVPLLPDTEQAQAADILDTIDAAIEHTEELITKLKQVRAGLLFDLLTKGLDEKGNIRSEKTHKFKDSPLGRIPDEWNVLSLGGVAESLSDGPFGSNLKTEHYVSEPGVRVVRLQNLEVGRYDDDDKAFISESWASRLKRHKVVPEDVLIASMGDDNHPIARACLYPTELPPAINKADCFRLRSRSSLMLNAFAMYSMNADYCRPEIARLVQGVTRMRINVTNVKQLWLKVPSIPEQVRIVGRLRDMDVVVEKEKAILRKIRRMRQGLMEDLLTGKVRVNNLLKQ